MKQDQPFTVSREAYTITTDQAHLDVDVIHGYLTRAYWKPGVPRQHVINSLEHALCFGLFEYEHQIGFARVITDYVDFAYLCDVFVLESHQGRGLGRWLLATVLAYPGLQSTRHMFLATRDAQEFYRQFGFVEHPKPEKLMVKIMSERDWYNPNLIAAKPVGPNTKDDKR